MKCLLCSSESIQFQKDVFQCRNCDLHFKNPSLFLNEDDEKVRYDLHTNGEDEIGYQQFLMKLIAPIKNQLVGLDTHLDFGSGKNPMYKKLIGSNFKRSEFFDIYFYPDEKILQEKYDLVTCSEVVEHFYNPKDSWTLLNSLIERNGYLAVRTSIFSNSINYDSWWYKNDPTHVCFYTENTMNYIAKKLDLEIIYFDNQSVTIFKRVR